VTNHHGEAFNAGHCTMGCLIENRWLLMDEKELKVSV